MRIKYVYKDSLRQPKRHKADWSQLPKELLIKILNLTDKSSDYCRIRAVCKNWHSLFPCNGHLLHSSLPRCIPTRDPVFRHPGRPVFLVGSAVCLLQPLVHTTNPSKPWLVSVEELNPGKLRFRYPLTKDALTLPDGFPEVLNVSDYQASVVCRGFKLCYSDGDEDVLNVDGPFCWGGYPARSKVVVFDKNIVFVLVLYQAGNLGCLKLDSGTWKAVQCRTVKYFDDVIKFRGQICAIDRKGRAYLIDGRTLSVIKVMTEVVTSGFEKERRKLLVECRGDLYMVTRKGSEFEVYKLNEKEHNWDCTHRLVDQILIVTLDNCFFLDVQNFPGCRGNCILFPKNCFPVYAGGCYGYDHRLFEKASNQSLEIGVFYLDEPYRTSSWSLFSHRPCRLISSSRGLSSMFWPPPPWISGNSCCFRSATEEETISERQLPLPLYSPPPLTAEGEKLSMSPRPGIQMNTFVEAIQDVEVSGPASRFQENMKEIVHRVTCSDVAANKVDWSELPTGLLQKIAEDIDYPSDYLRFRTVCQKWLSACPLDGPLLYQFLPHPIQMQTHQPVPSVYLVGSCLYLLQPLDGTLDIIKPWLISVEEVTVGKLKIRYPLTNEPMPHLPENFPRALNLSDFKASLISEGLKLSILDNEYENNSESLFPWGRYSSKNKVILFDNSTAIVLLYDHGGSLGSLKLDSGKWRFISYGQGFCFDDIVNFRGKICGIDRKGRAHLIDGCTSKVVKVMTEPMCAGSCSDNWKHLAESLGELYLINRLRGSQNLEVYMMNEKRFRWEKVKSLGNRILFVTFDCCFFVDAQHFPGCRGNCILFPRECFPNYVTKRNPAEIFEKASEYLEIGVFYLDENSCRLISASPELSDMFWPPPSWVLRDPGFVNSNSKGQVTLQKDSPSSVVSVSSSEIEIFPTDSEFLKDFQICSGDFVQEDVDDLNDSVPGADSSFQHPESGIITKGIHRTYANPNARTPSQGPVMKNVDKSQDITSPRKIAELGASPEKFEGVDIGSNYVPILQKVWEKHGNIIQGHVVHSDSLLKWAMESLAKMIVILESNSGSPFSDSEVHYLTATLLDLQMMHFRVDWLDPYVKCAVAYHESSQQLDIVKELEQTKSELLAEVQKLDEKLEEHRKLVIDKLSASAQADFRNVLS